MAPGSFPPWPGSSITSGALLGGRLEVGWGRLRDFWRPQAGARKVPKTLMEAPIRPSMSRRLDSAWKPMPGDLKATHQL